MRMEHDNYFIPVSRRVRDFRADGGGHGGGGLDNLFRPALPQYIGKGLSTFAKLN